MNDWKAQLAKVYKVYSTQQKNKKGEVNKFDKASNFKGKKGFNDTGIPLTPKAVKKQRKNRAGYRYPMHLQIINERRKKEAADRWGIKESKTDTTLIPPVRSYEPAGYDWNNKSESMHLTGKPYSEIYRPGFNTEDVAAEFTASELDAACSSVIHQEPEFKNKIEEEIYRLKNKK